MRLSGRGILLLILWPYQKWDGMGKVGRNWEELTGGGALQLTTGGLAGRHWRGLAGRGRPV